jgi:hypothetical protein
MSEQTITATEPQEGLLPQSPNPNPNFPVPSAPQVPQQEPQEPVQEPQAPQAYQSIIDQQNEQISALIAANEALTKQVTGLIQNGAQLGTPQQAAPQTPQPMQQFNPQPLSEGDDWSLESLAKEIGKK